MPASAVLIVSPCLGKGKLSLNGIFALTSSWLRSGMISRADFGGNTKCPRSTAVDDASSLMMAGDVLSSSFLPFPVASVGFGPSSSGIDDYK